MRCNAVSIFIQLQLGCCDQESLPRHRKPPPAELCNFLGRVCVSVRGGASWLPKKCAACTYDKGITTNGVSIN